MSRWHHSDSESSSQAAGFRRASSNQNVSIDALNLVVTFEEGERIHTESSYKHNEETLAALAHDSGFSLRQTWTDSRNWFADVLMVAE